MTIDGPQSNEPHDQLGALKTRFREQLQSGHSPRVEDFLPQVDEASRTVLLRDLLCLKSEFLQQSGKVSGGGHTERLSDSNEDIAETFIPQSGQSGAGRDSLADTVSNPPAPAQPSTPVADPGVPDFCSGPLSHLPPEMQWQLSARMEPASYARGETLVREGDDGDCLYVIRNGTASVSIIQEAEEEQRLGLVGPGHVVGEMALMGVETRTATVVAEEQLDVLVLGREAFGDLLAEHQEFANVMTTIIASRLGNQSQDALSTTTLNGYRIGRRLGRGGMSVVYDAVDEQTHHRVALKMMSHRLSFDEQARQWFHQEAETILSFDHPHIPKFVDQFDAFATSFIAIEYVDGASLSELLQRGGPFDEDSVLAVLGTIAYALQYAHLSGVVHRDVKPSNCMATNSGHVFLMDFGLSVPCFGGQAEAGAIVGTPAYMSPEQFRGEIRPESDWFSLGCVGFELMTGTRLLNPRSLPLLAEAFQNWDVQEIISRVPSRFSRVVPYVESFLSPNPTDRTRHLQDIVRHRGPLPIDDRRFPPSLVMDS